VEFGSLLGVPVRLHYTLVIAFILIAWTLAEGLMPLQYPSDRFGLSQVDYWVIGVVGAVALFVSVRARKMLDAFIECPSREWDDYQSKKMEDSWE